MNNVYDRLYDYEDVKIALCVGDFVNDKIKINVDYEAMIKLACVIRFCYAIDYDELYEEEKGYIQAYAYRFLNENIDLITTILKEGIL